VEEKGWITAINIKKGDELFTYEGNSVAITRVEIIAQPSKVFNFSVAGQHNYFVSDNKVLVHNQNWQPDVVYVFKTARRFYFNPTIQGGAANGTLEIFNNSPNTVYISITNINNARRTLRIPAGNGYNIPNRRYPIKSIRFTRYRAFINRVQNRNPGWNPAQQNDPEHVEFCIVTNPNGNAGNYPMQHYH
jgi:hypothetical protein